MNQGDYMIFESWKRAKFETAGHYEVLKRYGVNDERIGGWERAKITDEIFTKMRRDKDVSEHRYVELYIEELKSRGVIS